MPALPIIIVETQGRLEPTLNAACRGKPAHVLLVQDAPSLQTSLASHPPGIVLIEHQADLSRTVGLIEETVVHGSRVIVFLMQPVSTEARLVLRTAGAIQLIDHLPPFPHWQAWVDRWLEESSTGVRKEGRSQGIA